jgi:hypothetical protein
MENSQSILGEVYWITGGETADLLSLLAQAHVKPAWVDQTLWLGSAPPDFTPPGAFFAWAQAPLLDHYLLHAAGRAILTGGADLIVFGQQMGKGWAVALLASPMVVGRYNIMPTARLAAFFTLTTGCGELMDKIIAAGFDPAKLRALAVDGQDDPIILPGVKRLALPRGYGSCAVRGLNRLALRKKGAGVLLGRQSDSPALAVVVDKI